MRVECLGWLLSQWSWSGRKRWTASHVVGVKIRKRLPDETESVEVHLKLVCGGKALFVGK